MEGREGDHREGHAAAEGEHDQVERRLLVSLQPAFLGREGPVSVDVAHSARVSTSWSTIPLVLVPLVADSAIIL